MVERSEKNEQKIKALEERNRQYYDELRAMGNNDVPIFVNDELEITVQENDPSSNVSPVIVTVVGSKDQESYHIYPFGLGLIMAEGTRVLQVKSQLGLKVGLNLNEDLHIEAWDEGFPDEFCNQAEQIVGIIKQKIEEAK